MHGFSWGGSSTSVGLGQDIHHLNSEGIHPPGQGEGQVPEQTQQHCSAGKARKVASGLSGKETKESQLLRHRRHRKAWGCQHRWGGDEGERGWEEGRLSPETRSPQLAKTLIPATWCLCGKKEQETGKRMVPKIPGGHEQEQAPRCKLRCASPAGLVTLCAHPPSFLHSQHRSVSPISTRVQGNHPLFIRARKHTWAGLDKLLYFHRT